MPERDRAVGRLVQLLHNDGEAFVWDGLIGRVRAGQSLSPDEYDAAEKHLDEVWADIVDRVNWTRILLTASIIHLGKQEENEDHRDPDFGVGEVCGLCIRDALLSKEH